MVYLDDGLYYFGNSALRGGAAHGLIEIWKAPFFHDYSPVSHLTYWVDLALFGTSTWTGARLHSLLWFSAGALAIYSLFARLASRDRFGSRRSLFERNVAAQPQAAMGWARYAHELDLSPAAEDRALAGAAALTALRCADAHRLLIVDRLDAARIGAVALAQSGKAQAGEDLLNAELAKIPAAYREMTDCTRARVYTASGRSADAIRLLEAHLLPDHRAGMSRLRELCRDGRTTPQDAPPVLSIQLGSGDSAQHQATLASFSELLRTLADAYMIERRFEDAFNVSALASHVHPENDAARLQFQEINRRLQGR
ncbi:MAG TPA: hypothetical protein VEJ63_20570 [Planctomycetota bacterium]|nr:hypothetical protein [Planctomycetota bacterium]